MRKKHPRIHIEFVDGRVKSEIFGDKDTLRAILAQVMDQRHNFLDIVAEAIHTVAIIRGARVEREIELVKPEEDPLKKN